MLPTTITTTAKKKPMLLINDAQRHRYLVRIHIVEGIAFWIRFIIICTDLSAASGNIVNNAHDSLRYLVVILLFELFTSFILFIADSLYVILRYLGRVFYESDSDDLCNERKYLWPLATLTCLKQIDCYYDHPHLILLTRVCILIGFWLLRFIAFCLACACGNQYSPRGIAYAVISSFSLVISVFTIITEYLHYKRLWTYHPQNNYDATYNKAHLCFLPYSLINDQRITEWGTSTCKRGKKCESKSLLHLLVYHSGEDQFKPKHDEQNPTVFGFHQTKTNLAYIISQDARGFIPSLKGMLGAGVYFATSINHTETKAHNFGAYICVKVSLGRVYRTNKREMPSSTEKYDTVYYEHESGNDEFCILNSEQIQSWIITVNEDFDVNSNDRDMFNE
ncbi:unnamed protein product, partial [Didymodactylos carnosus]